MEGERERMIIIINNIIGYYDSKYAKNYILSGS